MELDLSTFEELKQMSGEDFIGELVDTYLDDAPRLVHDMQMASRAGDAESFRRAAHSLKSNSATFGAVHLAELAKRLELLAKDGKLDDAQSALPAVQRALGAVIEELKGLRQ